MYVLDGLGLGVSRVVVEDKQGFLLLALLQRTDKLMRQGAEREEDR